MNWEAIGAIGELLAAVGVIVSLVYLGIQIRQNTASLRSSTQQQLTQFSAQLNVALGVTPGAADVYQRGLLAPEELTGPEKAQLGQLLHAIPRILENAFLQHAAGALDDEMWLVYVAGIATVFTSPGGRQWWKSRSLALHSGFREFVEQEVLPRPEKAYEISTFR